MHGTQQTTPQSCTLSLSPSFIVSSQPQSVSALTFRSCVPLHPPTTRNVLQIHPSPRSGNGNPVQWSVVILLTLSTEHNTGLEPQLTDLPAAISILNPTADTVWFTNNTVTMNWTLSDPTSDTYLFRAFLSNTDQGLFQGNASIADSSKLHSLGTL